jgi:branched-chain amino acid transport system permease protein
MPEDGGSAGQASKRSRLHAPHRPVSFGGSLRLRAFHGRERYVQVGLSGLVLGLIAGWVIYKAFGSGFSSSAGGPVFVQVTLNGLTFAGLYFIVASGFTLIFGLMRIVNMAHGTLYLLGGYIAFSIQEDVSGSAGASTSGFGSGNVTVGEWLLPLVAACVCTGLAGLFIHQVFLRWNQGQELRQALITIALSIIAADQMLAHFGGIAEDIKLPGSIDHGVSVGLYGISYPLFRLIVLGVAVGLLLGLLLVFAKTRFGMIVRAGVDDRAMVSAMGINIQVVFAASFFIGSALAGLGGVFGGTMVALGPGEDQSFLLKALIVVIIGGMGSLIGAAVGALLLGLVEAYSTAYLVFGSSDFTYLSIVLTFGLIIFILAVRPQGLFGRPG